MNIIEWFNSNTDAGDAAVHLIIAYGVWWILWRLFIKKSLAKSSWGDFIIDEWPKAGSIVTFCFLLLAALIVVLLIASVQAVAEYGGKMIFALSAFWGGVAAFVTFLIKRLRR